jgi:hypothetical protein
MQEVIQKENEVVFELLPPNIKYECPRCKRRKSNKCFVYNKVLNERICNQCNRSVGTNPFYNPDYGKSKEFVGIKNFSNQEKYMLIKKYTNKGFSYLESKKKVEFDLSVVRHQKINKIEPQAISVQNLAIRQGKSELNKNLVKGLGMKGK